MKKRTSIFASILLVAVLCGCSTTLAPGGAYQGDTFLYQTDRTVVTLQASLDTFVTWEYRNRPAILAQWPQVTVAADKVRMEAPRWFGAIALARDSYLIVRNGPGGNAPETMALVKSSLTARVNDAATQVAAAREAVNTTGIPSKPILKINP